MTRSRKIAPRLEIVCDAALHEVGVVLDTIQTLLTAHQVPVATCDDMAIVLSEVLTNSIRHGYGPAGGWIACSVTICDGHLACQVTDAARPFDPSHQSRIGPDPSALAEGGYGWPLIVALAQGMEYRRRDGHNVLRFKIPISVMAPKVA